MSEFCIYFDVENRYAELTSVVSITVEDTGTFDNTWEGSINISHGTATRNTFL